MFIKRTIVNKSISLVTFFFLFKITPAIAGFELIKEGSYDKPSSPLLIVTEKQENKLLRKENERLLEENTELRKELNKKTFEKITIHYQVNQTKFTPSLYEADKLINFAYQASTIIISGYTDHRGKEKTNQMVAEKRAQAVKQFLIEYGVAEEKIHARGYTGNYISTQNTAVAQAKNRRVEIEFN